MRSIQRMRMILLVTAFLLGILLHTPAVLPQHGTAENGYWPMGYAGDTFTGNVTSEDDASRTITLTYTHPKNGKTETLTASIVENYTAKWKDGTLRRIKPSDIPIGTHIKVYYMTTEKKVEGKKVKTTSIFGIAGVPNVGKQGN